MLISHSICSEDIWEVWIRNVRVVEGDRWRTSLRHTYYWKDSERRWSGQKKVAIPVVGYRARSSKTQAISQSTSPPIQAKDRRIHRWQSLPGRLTLRWSNRQTTHRIHKNHKDVWQRRGVTTSDRQDLKVVSATTRVTPQKQAVRNDCQGSCLGPPLLLQSVKFPQTLTPDVTRTV